MKISVIIPVYNEQKTVLDVVGLVRGIPVEKEIILVDDCSTDGTRELLRERFGSAAGEVKVFYHGKNGGKGAAIRTALARSSGDYVIVQDADLEYSPLEITKLAEEAARTGAAAVYGSRFLSTRRSTSFAHYIVNWLLTALTNALFGSRLTDMETCYKMVRADVIKNMGIKAKRFEFEPEVTAKLLKKGIKILEVPISYRGRGYDEGKKITWRDGAEAVLTLFRLRFEK